jgi:hypothetical protein
VGKIRKRTIFILGTNASFYDELIRSFFSDEVDVNGGATIYRNITHVPRDEILQVKDNAINCIELHIIEGMLIKKSHKVI